MRPPETWYISHEQESVVEEAIVQFFRELEQIEPIMVEAYGCHGWEHPNDGGTIEIGLEEDAKSLKIKTLF